MNLPLFFYETKRDTPVPKAFKDEVKRVCKIVDGEITKDKGNSVKIVVDKEVLGSSVPFMKSMGHHSECIDKLTKNGYKGFTSSMNGKIYSVYLTKQLKEGITVTASFSEHISKSTDVKKYVTRSVTHPFKIGVDPELHQITIDLSWY